MSIIHLLVGSRSTYQRTRALKSLVATIACAVVLPGVVFGIAPELPRIYIDSSYRPSPGASIRVPAGASLQAAIDKAQLGDTILLEPGVTYIGPFRLKPKTGEGWINIQSATYAQLSSGRIMQSQFTSLPRLITRNSDPALWIPDGARNYRLVGLEIASEATLTWNIVYSMIGSQNIIFDRCYIHGISTTQSFRGIMMDGNAIAVVDSHIADIHYAGFDSQALGGSSGSGPYKIVNNYVSGAGENIMFGGSKPPPGIVPCDIEVRGNYVHKPAHWEKGSPTWDGSIWTIKNLFELKSACRVLVEGNVFDGNWPQAQTGVAILFTVSAGSTGCQGQVNDVTFRGNVVRNTVSGFAFLGYNPYEVLPVECQGESRRVTVENNLIIHRPDSRAVHISWNYNTHDYTIKNNTFAWTVPCRFGVFFTGGRAVGVNNALYGNVMCRQILGDSMGFGTMTLEKFIPNAAPLAPRFQQNLSLLPPGDTVRATPPPIAGNFTPAISPFVNAAAGDFRLGSAFPNVGADVDSLQTMALMVVAGMPMITASTEPVVPAPPVVVPAPPLVVPAGDGVAFATEMLAKLLGRPALATEISIFASSARASGQSSAITAVFAWPDFNNSSRFVAGLYVGLLNRDPEFSGWSFQRRSLLSGAVSQDNLVSNFLNSAEFKLKYGAQTTEAFVRMLYRQVLFRDAAPSELSFHVGTLVTLSRTQVAKNFLNSAEFRLGAEHRVTVFLVHACLRGRDASPEEKVRQAQELRLGKPLRQLVTELLPH